MSNSTIFCGSHNLTAPFWNNIVSRWLMDNGYQHEYREYPQYVGAIKKLQSEHNLTNFTQREVEFAIWTLEKKNM